jgi:hypothetical protein
VWFLWSERSQWGSGHVGGPLAALSFRCTGHLSSVWGHFCSVKNKNGMWNKRNKGFSTTKQKTGGTTEKKKLGDNVFSFEKTFVKTGNKNYVFFSFEKTLVKTNNKIYVFSLEKTFVLTSRARFEAVPQTNTNYNFEG